MSNNIEIHKGDIPENLDLGNRIAVDGEFMGLNVRRDPLCLIQLSSGNTDAHIIQFNRNNYNAPNLKKLLLNNRIQFIMHYARQDLLWLKYHLGVKVENIFCTKLASKIARTASSSHGYKDLVKEICGKDISKKEQQSDWGNPNLSTKQISYAAQDTEHLFEIKEKLSKMLIREKRMEIFEKCMKVLPVLVDMEIAGYKLSTFEH